MLGFLNLGTTGIFSQIILCLGVVLSTVGRFIVSLAAIHSLDTSNIPLVVTSKSVFTLPNAENHCSTPTRIYGLKTQLTTNHLQEATNN